MLTVNRPLINTNNHEDHYKTLVESQAKAYKNYANLRSFNSIQIGSAEVQIGSAEVAERVDWRPWIHGTIIEKGFKTIVPEHTKYSCQQPDG